MSTINSIPFRSTIFYRTDGTVAPIGTVFTISTNGLLNFSDSLSLNNLTASSITGNITTLSSITASTILTTGNNIALGQSVAFPNRYLELGTDVTDSVYLDFHSKDSTLSDYSTRIQSLGGATTGTGALNMTASTMGLMASSGVGIGTTVPQAPLHVYNALGVSLSNTNIVNYTQSAILGFNFGGGVVTGTRDSFRILSQTVNRDNGAGPTFFDYGAQADLIFQRKTNNLYSGGVNDKTYTEVMRLGGATGFVGIGTVNPTTILHINQGEPNIIRLQTSSVDNAYIVAAYEYLSINANYSVSGTRENTARGSAQVMLYQPTAGGIITFNTSPSVNTSVQERMRITSNGNVGIGLTNPAYTLDVNGGSSILSIGARCSGSDTVLDLINTSAAGYTWRIGSAGTGSGGGVGNLYIYGSSAGNLGVKMVIAPNGNVGIGVLSPGAALQVAGSVLASSFYTASGSVAANSGGSTAVYTCGDYQSGFILFRWGNGYAIYYFTQYAGQTSSFINLICGQSNAYTLAAVTNSAKVIAITMAAGAPNPTTVYWTVTSMTA